MWFNKTKWLDKIKKQTGIIRNIQTPKIDNKYISIVYEVYDKNKKGFKKFNAVLPRKVEINKEFLYFLGLRYGDGTNGARVGVVNKNLELIKETAKFLRKIFPRSMLQGSIYLYKKEAISSLPELKKDMKKIVDKLEVYDLTDKDVKGIYVFYVFITNAFFNRIYDSLIKDILSLFKILNMQEKGAFFAGFFDAEGNVNKRDRNFRWSQKTPNKVAIIRELLEKENYHARYDGSNFIIGHKADIWKEDLERFKDQVLPYLKHPEKKKEAQELLKGYYVMDSYKKIARIIHKNRWIDNKEVSKKAHRKRCRVELTALTGAGFLVRTRKRVDESFKYAITKKGTRWIMESG